MYLRKEDANSVSERMGISHTRRQRKERVSRSETCWPSFSFERLADSSNLRFAFRLGRDFLWYRLYLCFRYWFCLIKNLYTSSEKCR